MRRGTFNIKLDSIPKVAKKLGGANEKVYKEMARRTERATDMIWRVAHQRRPYISKEQMKAEGRSFRVSDPNAQLGVPVAVKNGGRLQASIKQRIKAYVGRFQGIVETRGVPYAGYIEFGTSKMRARPFMRPAIAFTKDALKRLFGMKADFRV